MNNANFDTEYYWCPICEQICGLGEVEWINKRNATIHIGCNAKCESVKVVPADSADKKCRVADLVPGLVVSLETLIVAMEADDGCPFESAKQTLADARRVMEAT